MKYIGVDYRNNLYVYLVNSKYVYVRERGSRKNPLRYVGRIEDVLSGSTNIEFSEKILEKLRSIYTSTVSKQQVTKSVKMRIEAVQVVEMLIDCVKRLNELLVRALDFVESESVKKKIRFELERTKQRLDSELRSIFGESVDLDELPEKLRELM